jgi:hypothetical protein
MLPVFSIPRIRKRLNMQKALPPPVVVQPTSPSPGAWRGGLPRVKDAQYLTNWTTEDPLGPEAYRSALSAFHAFIAQLNKKRWLAFSNSGIERFQFIQGDPFGGYSTEDESQAYWPAPSTLATGEFIMGSTLPIYEFARRSSRQECYGTSEKFLSPVIHGPGFDIRTPLAPWEFQTFCLSQEMMEELSSNDYIPPSASGRIR